MARPPDRRHIIKGARSEERDSTTEAASAVYCSRETLNHFSSSLVRHSASKNYWVCDPLKWRIVYVSSQLTTLAWTTKAMFFFSDCFIWSIFLEAWRENVSSSRDYEHDVFVRSLCMENFDLNSNAQWFVLSVLSIYHILSFQRILSLLV